MATLRSRAPAAVAVTAATAFVVLAVLTRTAPVADTDVHAVATVHRWALEHRDSLAPWRWFSDWLGPDVLRLAAVPAAVVLWWLGRRHAAALVAVAALGTLVLSAVTKVLVGRDRPQFADPIAHAAGQSYPSGHALTSFVAGAVLLVVLPRKARRVAFVPVVALVTAVGLSRIVLGVHFPTDILGGWLLGFALTAGCTVALARLPTSPGGAD